MYDNPKNPDGSDKENALLGEFDLVDGIMDDYAYEVIVRSKDDGELYILNGREVSGYRNPGKGGTRHFLELLKENYFVKKYIELTHL